jgi:L-Ala-D/L-Glu epimerase
MAKIKAIRAWSADLGNTKPYTIAFKTVDEVLNAFVEVELDNGLVGMGAGNPSKDVTGEDFQTTVHTLSEKNMEFLIGRDIRTIHQLAFEVWTRFSPTPAAQASLDIALFDAFTQFLGVPLVVYLGQKIKSLPTSITLGIKSVSETIEEAWDYEKRGFRILKVKLGKDLEEDIERVVKLRERFGRKFTIRVDANQGYSKAQTLEFYERTKSLNMELVEQPLPAKAIEELKSLPEEVRQIIAADESLLSATDALRLIYPPKAAGIFNIKLMKCGGVREALRIANIGMAGQIDLFWGCNDESIVSIAAALHTAFACSNTKYLDLDGSLDLGKDIVSGGFKLENGVMSCLDTPGLGLSRK